MEVRWGLVGINVLRDAALGTGFAKTTRGEIRFAVFGNPVCHTDTGTSLVLSVGRCVLLLFLWLFRGRCRGGGGAHCGGHRTFSRGGTFFRSFIGGSFDTALHARGGTLHILQDVVANNGG